MDCDFSFAVLCFWRILSFNPYPAVGGLRHGCEFIQSWESFAFNPYPAVGGLRRTTNRCLTGCTRTFQPLSSSRWIATITGKQHTWLNIETFNPYPAVGGLRPCIFRPVKKNFSFAFNPYPAVGGLRPVFQKLLNECKHFQPLSSSRWIATSFSSSLVAAFRAFQPLSSSRWIATSKRVPQGSSGYTFQPLSSSRWIATVNWSRISNCFFSFNPYPAVGGLRPPCTTFCNQIHHSLSTLIQQ